MAKKKACGGYAKGMPKLGKGKSRARMKEGKARRGGGWPMEHPEDTGKLW